METCLKCHSEAIETHGLGRVCGSAVEVGLRSTCDCDALRLIPSNIHRLGCRAVSAFLDHRGRLYSSQDSLQNGAGVSQSFFNGQFTNPNLDLCLSHEVRFDSEVMFLSLRWFFPITIVLFSFIESLSLDGFAFFFSALPEQKKRQTVLCPRQALIKFRGQGLLFYTSCTGMSLP